MRIIVFSWTTPALLAHPDPLAKTCTRREWADRTALAFHEGDLVQAYDRNPRNGGRPVAHIRLTQTPRWEHMDTAPADDYVAEGFAWFDDHPDVRARALPKLARSLHLTEVPSMLDLWAEWENANRSMWVVRFEVERIIVPLDEWLQTRMVV